MEDLDRFIGAEVERLGLLEREALWGRWIALEIYTPRTLPLRRIEAVGDSAVDCARRIASRGLDPRRFEFSRM
jgi:hypothetical protein